MSEKKLFLLDAFALIYRAHFAMSQNPRLTTNGINTGAILGFTNSLLEIITKEKPSHIGVAFDTHAPTFRHEEYKEYKATRQEQPEEIKVAIPYCLKIVEGFNIPILMKDGYEADDLIGTIAKKAGKEGFKVYMMTPDKDFAQLVDENIFLFKPRRMGNGVDIMGIPEVLTKFDIDKVDLVRDVLGLKGDSVDNIPGIPGIGDKTASKLLKEYGSVEEIVAHAHELKGALQKRVQDHGQQGIMSKDLATIKIDSPIEFNEEDLKYGDPNPGILQPIFDDLEFKTIARRVFQEENDIKNGDIRQLDLFDGETEASVVSDNKESINTSTHSYHLVEGKDAINKLIDKLKSVPSFCFDTETTSLKTREAKLVGIAFAIEKGEAWYVPCAENAQEVANAFKDVLENEQIRKIGQNLKYDIQVMRNYDVHVKGQIFDTMLAHFLLDSESNNSMDWLADKFLNYKTISFENLVGPKGKNQKTIDQVDSVKVKDYACEDADITLQLKELLEKDIVEHKLEKLLHEVEEPLSFVLADMEYQGVKVDTTTLEKMSKELDDEMQRVQQEIFDTAGVEFNIGSPKQLGEILFDKLKLIDKPKRNKDRTVCYR